MGNFLSKIAICIAMGIVASSTAYGYDFKVGSILYNFNTGEGEEGTVSVADRYVYNRYGSYNWSGYTGHVIIPEKVEYEGTLYTVTKISSGCFRSATLTELTIPLSVNTIGSEAFASSDLARINGLHTGMTFESGAFSDCKLRYVTLPGDLTKIPNNLFRNTPISKIVIPKGVRTIGSSAFSSTSLTEIEIPESVTFIGKEAFSNCRSLRFVYVPESVKTLTEGAFNACKVLQGVVVSGPISSVEPSVFPTNDSIRIIVLPSSVTTIDSYGQSPKMRTAVMPDNVETINNLLYQCHSVEEVYFPPTLRTLHAGALGCTWIKTIWNYADVPTVIDCSREMYRWGLFDCGTYNCWYKKCSDDCAAHRNYYEDVNLKVRDVNTYIHFSNNRYFESIGDDWNYNMWSSFDSMGVGKPVYQLKYEIDGKEFCKQNIPAGMLLETMPSPYKDFMVFSGWTDIPERMPENNIVVTGSFSPIEYNVTFIDGDESWEAVTDVIDADNRFLCEKEGYTFNGWNICFDNDPNHLTLLADYTVNTYTINYFIGDNLYASIDYKYGDQIIPIKPSGEVAAGFEGWVDCPDTMPAHDINLYAANSMSVSEILNGINGSVEVYSIDGKHLMTIDRFELIKEVLPSGIYVIMGKVIRI